VFKETCPDIGFSPVSHKNIERGNRAELYLVPILVSNRFSYIFMKISNLGTVLSLMTSQYWFQPGFLIC
jgi:hypothetical protein